MSVDYIYNNDAHIYTCIHIYIHTYSHTCTHTYKNKVLPKVYYSCHLVTGYHKSYQQYFDILLSCKKLEIYCYKKSNKKVNQIYSKESNNPYKV